MTRRKSFQYIGILLISPHTPVASLTKEVTSRLAIRPLKINGHLTNRGLIFLVKEPTIVSSESEHGEATASTMVCGSLTH